MWALGPYWHRCERLASGGPMWALSPQGTHSCKRPSSFRVLKRWAFGTWEKHCSRHEIWCWRCSLFWGPFAHIFVWQTQSSYEEMWKSFDLCLCLFKKISKKVADSLGYNYPDYDENVTKYLETQKRISNKYLYGNRYWQIPICRTYSKLAKTAYIV